MPSLQISLTSSVDKTKLNALLTLVRDCLDWAMTLSWRIEDKVRINSELEVGFKVDLSV